VKRMWKIAMALAALLAIGSAPVLAQPGPDKSQRGREPQKTAGDKVREVLPPAERVFTRQEQTIIRDWFRTNRSGLPPGLAKRERLPPGLERQLQKNGKLPPGLEKKLHPFPPELETRLRILPTGYRRVVIGRNIILLNEEAGLIYDIVRNILP
jgi:hypothetical protein